MAACTPSVLLSLRDNVRRHVCTLPRKKKKASWTWFGRVAELGVGGDSLFFLHHDFYDLRPDRGNELFRGRTAKVSGSVSVFVHFFLSLLFTKHEGSVSSCTRNRLASCFYIFHSFPPRPPSSVVAEATKTEEELQKGARTFFPH